MIMGQEAKKIGEVGFEPTTPASRTLCASQAALLPDVSVLLYRVPGRKGRGPGIGPVLTRRRT
jgi:hypothetical protein